ALLQSLTILLNRLKYLSGTNVFASPWYHATPFITKSCSGAIMPLYSPAGFQLKNVISGSGSAILAPILYFHLPVRSMTSPPASIRDGLSSTKPPSPELLTTLTAIVFSPAFVSPAGIMYFLGG